MNERFRRIRQHEVSLALAVKPVDAVTGAPLGARANVSVEDVTEEPIRNPSDYWLFLTPPVSLPADQVEITVDAGREYVDVVDEFDVNELDPPGIVIDVYPSVEYHFSVHETVLIGRVEDDGDPVVGAPVSIEHAAPRTQTGSDGRFALPVRGIARPSEVGDQALRVHPDDDPPRPVFVHHDNDLHAPRLTVKHDDGETTVEPDFPDGEQTFMEGQRTVLSSVIEV